MSDTSIQTLIQLFTKHTEEVRNMLDVISDKDNNEQKDLISKNIISGKGSTFNREREQVEEEAAPKKDEPIDINKTYKIGSILAKAFYDFNQSKKRDLYKEGTKIATPSRSKTLDKAGIVPKRRVDENERQVKSGASWLDTARLLMRLPTILRVGLGGILRSFRGGRIGQGIARILATARSAFGKQSIVGRAVTGISRTIGTAQRVGRSVTSVVGRAANLASRGVRAVGRGVTSIGSGISRLAGKAKTVVTGGTAATSLLSKTAVGAKILSKGSSILGGAKVVGGIVGKVAAPVALAVDSVTAITKLSSQQGRDNLRAQAEQLDYSKNFWKTLGKSILSPIETASAIGIATTDMIKSTLDAKKSQETLDKSLAERGVKTTEELYEQSRASLLDRWDKDKDGIINENEKLRQRLTLQYENQRSGGVFESADGTKWSYDSKQDKLVDGNRALTRDEFLSLQNTIPKPTIKETKKEPEPVQARIPAAIQAKITPTAPPSSIVNKVDLSSVKPPAPIVDVNLNDQNSLIKQQTNVMLAILDVSKKQLVVSGETPPSTPTIINTPPQQTQASRSIELTDGRGSYLGSPYSLA